MHTSAVSRRATLSALVVMDVHARDVVAQLAAEGIEGQPQHFSWLSQLRMYWEEPEKGSDNDGKTIIVRMMNAQVRHCVMTTREPGRLGFV
jgi:dynein heavy chain